MSGRILGFVSRTPQCSFLTVLLVGSSVEQVKEGQEEQLL